MIVRLRFGTLGTLAQALALALALAATACVPPTGEASSSASVSPTVPAPSASAVPSFIRPTPNPSPTFLVYEVQAGDSLTSIARLFGTTARSIAYWNRARYPSLDPDSSTYEPDRIEVGWTLQLIPTEVVDEDELSDPTPTPSPTPDSPAPSASAGSS